MSSGNTVCDFIAGVESYLMTDAGFFIIMATLFLIVFSIIWCCAKSNNRNSNDDAEASGRIIDAVAADTPGVIIHMPQYDQPAGNPYGYHHLDSKK